MIHAISPTLTNVAPALSGRRLARAHARDRRLAAIHEAGHFVVGRHVGLRWSEAWISRVGEPTLYDKAWNGNHRCLEQDRAGLSVRRQQTIALAGCVAERAWQASRHPYESYACDEEDLLDPNVMSATDWSSAGHEPGEPSIRLMNVYLATEKLLVDGGPLWPALLAAARTLILEHFVEHGSVHPRIARATSGLLASEVAP